MHRGPTPTPDPLPKGVVLEMIPNHHFREGITMRQLRPRISVTSLILVTVASSLSAQGTRSDYERSARLPALTRDKVTKLTVRPNWFAEGKRFWYRNDLGRGVSEFVLVDTTGARTDAFDHAKLAKVLEKASGQKTAPARLPIDGLAFEADLSALRFNAYGKRWECSLGKYELRELGSEEKSQSTLTSLGAPRRTRRTGDVTSIRFVNKTSADALIDWVDPDGNRKRYATIKPGDKHDQHTYAGHVWIASDPNGKTIGIFEATDKADAVAVIESERSNEKPLQKPDVNARVRRAVRGESYDGRWAAEIREHNVVLRDLQSGEETSLTRDGTAADGYGGEVFWSPDSRYLVALRAQAGEDHQVALIESSPRDQVQPKLTWLHYLKPGDRIPQTKPRLFDVAERREIPVADDLFQNPWSIDHWFWQPDSKRFWFLFNERGHQTLRLIAVEAETGKATAIIDEHSKTFLDYAGKLYLQPLSKTGEVIWMSERNGWNHLYLIDSQTGAVKNPITHGNWVVRGVDRVDEERREIWFRASGLDPDQDPYFIHHCRVSLDGSNMTRLTAGNGTHSIEFSPNNEFLIDSYSRVDLPPVSELRRVKDGSFVCELECADWSELLATGWKPPERFVAKGRDDLTDIHGVIYRPTNFDESAKYPVIEQIYAGPHGSHVPKKFQPFFGLQSLAELGFIIVQIDGMGTSNRSKAFHDVCWKNLADAGFPDRIRWMQAAAAKYPQMDLTRVGIYGGSAGGQNALGALLHHPAFYKVAVADCGCHDNRMDKIWWNELWMGWPVGPHYADQSNVTNAGKLQGKLLLTVGELDKNVDPASTMQVVNALIAANKDFDLIVFPGAGHGIGESPYGVRRRQDYFVRNLLGVEPRR
jgi:dipeptidyl aminopeptidase/acylaminoacyl peptidase